MDLWGGGGGFGFEEPETLKFTACADTNFDPIQGRILSWLQRETDCNNLEYHPIREDLFEMSVFQKQDGLVKGAVQL